MVDRYTKTVLTVIAAALLWLCGRDVLGILPVDAHAVSAPSPQHVIVANWRLGSASQDNYALPVVIVGIQRGNYQSDQYTLKDYGWQTIDVNPSKIEATPSGK